MVLHKLSTLWVVFRLLWYDIRLRSQINLLVPYFHSYVHLWQEISRILAPIQCPQDASLGNGSSETSGCTLKYLANILLYFGRAIRSVASM